jgi:guanylate kinase
MKRINLIIISGDHGAGKSTMASSIISQFKWVKVVRQYTSRKPRNDGQETENYFASLEDVEKCDIVGSYIDGDGAPFKIGYKFADINQIILQGCCPLLIGHKAIIEQLRQKFPRSSTLEIFLKGKKELAMKKIVLMGNSTLEKAKLRLERGWLPTADSHYTSYIIDNNYDDATIQHVLEIVRGIRLKNLSGSPTKVSMRLRNFIDMRI